MVSVYNFNNIKSELKKRIGKSQHQWVDNMFISIVNFIRDNYVSSKSTGTLYSSIEKLREENSKMRKEINGYKFLIKQLGLSGLNSLKTNEVNENGIQCERSS
jgi:hypothetical protein